ncbi:YopX family protein (plasmid) [Levilactobacillus brevis]|uniref:YopX family protein n=1 Tax=Levilactobacillus brevis TaxID=1580 RepID=UPI0022775E47|nr:YopX family protein [Levilactobacillus brevis]WAE46389.1 YopX family protein [Levilactobacillus brevis]
MMVPKFRAWNGYRKIMADYVSAIQNGETLGTPSSVNVIVKGKNETWDIKNDHVKLLQYTGLKDANGKEIYKGDIVRMQRPGFHEYDCYEVKYFIQDVCIFKIVKVTDGSTLFESPSNGHDVEIIGNVHENPELVEG